MEYTGQIIGSYTGHTLVKSYAHTLVKSLHHTLVKSYRLQSMAPLEEGVEVETAKWMLSTVNKLLYIF